MTPQVEGALDFAHIKIRADRLDRSVNGQLLPNLGLHAALVGGLILVNQFAPSTWLFDCFAAAALVIGLMIAGQWFGNDKLYRKRCADAIYLLIGFAIACLPLSGSNCAALLAILFAVLAGHVMAGFVSTNNLQIVPFYYAVLLLARHDLSDQFPFWYLLPFVLGVAALWRRQSLRHGLGLFTGAAIVLIGPFQKQGHPLVNALVISAVFLLLFTIYDVAMTRLKSSNMRNFTGQGVAMAILLLTVLIINSSDTPQSTNLWEVTAVATVLFGMMTLFNRRGESTRLAWILIAAVLAIWSEKGTEADFPIRFVLSLCAIGALSVEAAYRANYFSYGLARIALVIFGLKLHDTVTTGLRMDSNSFLTAQVMDYWVLLALMAVSAMLLQLQISYARPVPWWYGFIAPRLAVTIRKLYRFGSSQVTAIPIVGQTLNVIRKLFASLRYLKSGAIQINLGDLQLLLVAVMSVLIAEKLLQFQTPHILAVASETLRIRSTTAIDLVSWCIGGTVFFCLGQMRNQSLFRFISAAFVMMPMVELLTHFRDVKNTELAVVATGSGLILFMFGIARRGGFAESRRLPHLQRS